MNNGTVMHILSSGFNGGIEVMLANYVRYTNLNHIFVFVWDKGPNYDWIVEQGFKTYFLDCHSKGPLKTARSAIAIARNEDPAVIVTHHGNAYVRFLGELARKNTSKKIHYYYSHSDCFSQVLVSDGFKSKILNTLNKYCIKKATKIIAISEAVKKSIHECYGIDYNKIVTIYNGADIKSFDYPPHIKEDTIHIAYAGRLVEEKGVQVTLEALCLLPETVKWDFTVVGDGVFRDKLEKLTCEYGIAEKVFFKGNRTDVHRQIQNSDIFIHACLCEEGFGVGIVEAMAAGKICIASKAGGIPEIIDDCQNGFLFEKGNSLELLKLIENIISDVDSWEKIQINAKIKAQMFGIANFAHELDSELVKAMN